MRVRWKEGHSRVLVTIGGPTGRSMEISAVLDTGAHAVMISPATAEFLEYDLKNAPEAKLYSASGPFTAKQLTLSWVEAGDRKADNVLAVCAEFPTEQIDGLLGLSWINNFRVTFDKRNEEILIG